MTQGIFSTYKQGENRVTSSLIQVLKHLPVNVVEAFLRFFSSNKTEGAQNFIKFENQIKGVGSVPDAGIFANFNLLFETKIVQGSIDHKQMTDHVKFARDNKATLVYLTPDLTIPKMLRCEDIVWKSFQNLDDFISEILADQAFILSERDQFLLKNLQILFVESGLLPKIDEVVIVAASTAWPVYKKHGVYVCQANRSFRDVKWIGFYAEGQIQPSIAHIKERCEEFEFSEGNLQDDAGLNTKLSGWLKDNEWAKGLKLQVFDLTTSGSHETETLPNPIPNDLTNNSGRRFAYTQGQRYILLETLKIAKTTSNL